MSVPSCRVGASCSALRIPQKSSSSSSSSIAASGLEKCRRVTPSSGSSSSHTDMSWGEGKHPVFDPLVLPQIELQQHPSILQRERRAKLLPICTEIRWAPGWWETSAPATWPCLIFPPRPGIKQRERDRGRAVFNVAEKARGCSPAPKRVTEMLRVGHSAGSTHTGSVPRKGRSSNHTLREEEKNSTYRSDVPKASGRASRDGAKQEPPGCGNELHRIPLENMEKRHGQSRPSTTSLWALSPCHQE